MSFSATLIPPVPSQPARLAGGCWQTQGRYTLHSAGKFPWNDLEKSRHEFIVGTNWAMTTIVTRRDDQFFDSKRLQTINEETEVRFFHPYEPLGYTRDGVDFSVLEEIRQLDMRRREGFAKRLFVATKSAVYRLISGVRDFYRKIFGCL